MHPYEIRQLKDGSIDYNNYIARPVSLLRPKMRRVSREKTSPTFWLLTLITIALLGILPLLAGGNVSAVSIADNRHVSAPQPEAH